MNESMLTGEAMPVNKSVGDEVLAGTVNIAGPVWIEATKVGPASTLQGIVRLVEQAQVCY
jgi:cation transport ATPase